MNITEFYNNAKSLLDDVNAGRVDPTTLSQEGRLVLDIAAKKISVNDLSNEGRQAIGIEPLPETPGLVQRMREGSINVQADLAKMLGLDVFADRTREMVESVPHALGEVPGQLGRAGQSFGQAAQLAGQGQFGHAAAELGGGLAETFNAGMGAMAPLTYPLVPGAVAGGMAAEKLADVVGLPQSFNVGAAEVTPRMVGEFGGMALPGVAGLAAGRVPRAKMPPIPEAAPTLRSISKSMMDEQINISQEMKTATGARKAELNARAASLRKARDEIRRGNYESKKDLLDLLYDKESQEALNAEWRTRYVDPYPAGQQFDPMGGMAPRVADIASAERARATALLQEVGLDPNQYLGPATNEVAPGTIVRPPKGKRGRPSKGGPTSIEEATPPLTPSVEIGTIDQLTGRTLEQPGRPQRWNVGRMRHELQEDFPLFRQLSEEQLRTVAEAADPNATRYDLSPESFGKAIEEVASPRAPAPDLMEFPLYPEVSLGGASKGATKGKTGEGKPASRGQRVNRVATFLQQANKGMNRNTAVKAAKKVVETTDRARAEELPPAPRRGKAVEPKVDETKPLEQVVEETKAAVDDALIEQTTRELESKPPVADTLKPTAEPTPEVPSVVPAAAAPPVESGAPLPAQPVIPRRRGRPVGTKETAMRGKTLQQLTGMGFTRAEAEAMYAKAKTEPKLMDALYEMTEEWRKNKVTKDDLLARSERSGLRTPEQVMEAEPLREAMSDVEVATASRRATEHVLSEMSDRARVRTSESLPEDTGFWRPEDAGGAAIPRGHERVAKPAMDADLKMTYNAANDLLETKGRKLVISTEASPGGQPETVFILRRRDGSVIHGEGEMAGRELTFKKPFDAVAYVEAEGPGAAAYTPHGTAANVLLEPSANLQVLKPLEADLGITHQYLRINTPGFVSRTDPTFHGVFSSGVKYKLRLHRMVNALRRRGRQIVEQLDPKEQNDLFLLGERENMTKVQWDEFYSQVSDKTKQLWDKEFRQVMDESFNLAKRYDPNIKYRQNYVTHFPTDMALQEMWQSLQKADDLAKRFPNEPRYVEQARVLKDHMREMKARRESLANRRYRKMPDGGYFGPLDEARALNIDFARNLSQVLERYFDGLERKALIDRMAPIVKRAYNAESLVDKPHMRAYMLDWFDGVRGTYGQRWRLAIENTLDNLPEGIKKAIGADDQFKRHALAKDVDDVFNTVNGLQAMYYMGFRIKPVAVNSLQWFMTGMPEVGVKHWLIGESAIFRPKAHKFARQLGLIDFVPDNLGEIHKLAAESMSKGNPLKTFELITSAGTRVSMKAFQVVEMGNHVKASWAGFNYARNVLGKSPIEAANYARALSLRTNYILDPINTPLAFLGPGKMIGFLKRFQINYFEQFKGNAERMMKGEAGPFVRQLAALLAVGGTPSVPLYRELSDWMMKTYGFDLPKFYPFESLTSAMGLGSGLAIETAVAPFTTGAGGSITDPFMPVILSTIDAPGREGVGALAPRVLKEMGPAAAEMSRGQAYSTTTGKPIANRSTTDKILSSMGLQPSAQTLRNRYLRDIENAFAGGRHDVAARLRNEAQKKGIIINGATYNAIRESVKRESRGRSTGLQLWDEVKKNLGSLSRGD